MYVDVFINNYQYIFPFESNILIVNFQEVLKLNDRFLFNEQIQSKIQDVCQAGARYLKTEKFLVGIIGYPQSRIYAW